MTVTYFMSGMNHAGEIAAMKDHGQDYGVCVSDLDKAGHAVREMTAKRIIVGVTRNAAGRPIIMFDRRRAAYASMPEGDVEVQVGSGKVFIGFRKIAANVARVVRGGKNVMTDVMCAMFGADAGARGAGHHVVIEMTATGWRMSEADIEKAKASGAKVFVDSGAFAEVSFDPAVGGFAVTSPITDEMWRERIATMTHIARELGSQAYLVAPDRVGDQDVTLERLACYVDNVREWRDLGAHVIVPLQRGKYSQVEFDTKVAAILGFDDYIRGIPSKKAAATVEEIAALSAELPEDVRIHLLGMGPAGKRYTAVRAAIRQAVVFCDSVRITALVGRTNGPGGGPRILTKLLDEAAVIFGAGKSFAEVYSRKRWSVSAWLSVQAPH